MGAQLRVTLDGYPRWVLARFSEKLGVSERDGLLLILHRYAELDAEYLRESFDISLDRFQGAEVVGIDRKKSRNQST